MKISTKLSLLLIASTLSAESAQCSNPLQVGPSESDIADARALWQGDYRIREVVDSDDSSKSKKVLEIWTPECLSPIPNDPRFLTERLEEEKVKIEPYSNALSILLDRIKPDGIDCICQPMHKVAVSYPGLKFLDVSFLSTDLMKNISPTVETLRLFMPKYHNYWDTRNSVNLFMSFIDVSHLTNLTSLCIITEDLPRRLMYPMDRFPTSLQTIRIENHSTRALEDNFDNNPNDLTYLITGTCALRQFTSLRKFELPLKVHNNPYDQITVLATSDFSDLSCLHPDNIEELDLTGTEIVDYTPLLAMPKLMRLKVKEGTVLPKLPESVEVKYKTWQ